MTLIQAHMLKDILDLHNPTTLPMIMPSHESGEYSVSFWSNDPLHKHLLGVGSSNECATIAAMYRPMFYDETAHTLLPVFG